ncbi:muscle, skeletal receptor tyrosine-protein kinase-like isoform X2 [Antedon mediterranea]|uniref:muscle, skeletal receptor tyrosine-protein kinase-like isoform X2 n=1 Tax=Antedon mediterranea TaxID=105859 RepID=UPI003AF7512E
MKLIFLILFTSITEVVSQGRGCIIEGDTSFPEGTNPTLKCVCPNSDATDKLWWCLTEAGCEQTEGLEVGAHYNIESDYRATERETSSVLTIKNIAIEDKGEYTCRSTTGNSFSHTITSVYADVSTLDPEGDAQLEYGEDLTLTCTSDPSNTIEWTKDEKTVLDQGDNPVGVDDDVVNVKGGILKIKDANINHAGLYQCNVAKNSERKRSVELWTKIDVKADLSVKVTEGKDAEIKCVARSYPQPKVTWRVPGQNQTIEGTKGNTDDDDDTYTYTSTLQIMDVTQRQYYTCIASHQFTNSTQTDILLRVRGKLAWLWPFLIILGISIILAAIFVTLHFKEGRDGDEEEDEEESPMISGKPKNIPAATPADPDA